MVIGNGLLGAAAVLVKLIFRLGGRDAPAAIAPSGRFVELRKETTQQIDAAAAPTRWLLGLV